MSDERYQRGLKTRREVLGNAHVDKALANATSFDAEFQRFITEMVWGDVWSRPHLDHRTRHMITIAVLAALGRENELKMHVKATPNSGVTPEDLKEVFHQVAVYAGVPAANSAFAAAKSVYAELDSKDKSKEADDGHT
jgi:4-carboxymuconolactone decarboxylase